MGKRLTGVGNNKASRSKKTTKRLETKREHLQALKAKRGEKK
jgi:hypothetical protein